MSTSTPARIRELEALRDEAIKRWEFSSSEWQKAQAKAEKWAEYAADSRDDMREDMKKYSQIAQLLGREKERAAYALLREYLAEPTAEEEEA
jgi:hypothetical protein